MHVNPQKPNQHRLIAVRELAGKLDRSISSIWADVAAGALPKPIKLGGSTRWAEAEIDRHIDRLLAERDGAK